MVIMFHVEEVMSLRERLLRVHAADPAVQAAASIDVTSTGGVNSIDRIARHQRLAVVLHYQAAFCTQSASSSLQNR